MITQLQNRLPVRGTARALALLACVSALAFGLAAPVAAQESAGASDASSANATGAASGAEIQELVVTGTRIRGVAPVGSALIQIGQEEMKNTGLTSTADILNTVPSVLSLGGGDSYAGGQSQAGSVLNSLAYGKSPNMRGFGVGATLSLVNGHRMPYEGANMNEFDGDNYPSQMISRIDVVQDGGSAIYGADAIAGTVNYILRSPENTLETYGGYGTADGQDTWYATGVVGKTWSDDDSAHKGGFIFSYSHTFQSAFKASSRPDLYNDDFSPYGVPYTQPNSAPGNVAVADAFGNVTYYGIPAGQDGQNLTLSQLSTTANKTNPWALLDAIPQIEADHYAVNFNQNVTDWLQIFGDGLYVDRDVFLQYPNSGTTNFVNASVPNSNPYSPCNPSHYAGGIVTGPAALVTACGAGSLNVAYNDVFDIGPGTRSSDTATVEFGGGFKVTMPYDWSFTASAYNEYHKEPVLNSKFVAGTPDPATFNYFCDPQTIACNSTSTINSINAGNVPLFTKTTYMDQDYSINADGKLFALPAGNVRLAVGGEYYQAKFLNQNSFGENVLDPRTIKSAYGELFIPLLGDGFDLPGINKLEIDIAGRYDDYTLVGSTENPKIGVNWWPVQDLKIHASYGTSFRAPGLADDDPSVQHGYFEAATPGVSISPAICPACQTNALAGAVSYQVGGGANGDLGPETSKTYSLGADWTPRQVPGLVASVNYWWTNYSGQVNYPAYNAGAIGAINQGIYNSQIIYNPMYFPTYAANNPQAFFGNFPNINTAGNADCAAVYGKKVTTQALYDSLINCVNAGGDTAGALFGPPYAPDQVLSFQNGHRINAGTTVGDGIDFSADYSFDTDIGTWKIGGVAEYIRSWRVATISGAPVVEEVNRFGYPLQFKARGELGWNREFGFGELSAFAFVNYANAYEMDAALLPAGAPASRADIDAYTTMDLTLAYGTGSSLGTWIAKDITLTVSVQNLFDTEPPLVLDQGGAAGAGTRFDPSNADPVGRTVQIQLGKKFW